MLSERCLYSSITCPAIALISMVSLLARMTLTAAPRSRHMSYA